MLGVMVGDGEPANDRHPAASNIGITKSSNENRLLSFTINLALLFRFARR
jgi:hypothetical protein